jgi:hypothetical protein
MLGGTYVGYHAGFVHWPKPRPIHRPVQVMVDVEVSSAIPGERMFAGPTKFESFPSPSPQPGFNVVTMLSCGSISPAQFASRVQPFPPSRQVLMTSSKIGIVGTRPEAQLNQLLETQGGSRTLPPVTKTATVPSLEKLRDQLMLPADPQAAIRLLEQDETLRARTSVNP